MHPLGVGGPDLFVGFGEEPLFVGLPAGSLDRKNIGNAVAQLTGKPVLGAGGHLVPGQGAAEQQPHHNDIDDQNGSQDDHIKRHQRSQKDNGQNGRRDQRNQRVVEEFYQRGVGVRELGGLADQGAAETAVVKGHALVGKGVEHEGGKVIVAEDLELPDGVVLKFRADLPDQIRHHQQNNVRQKGGKYLVRRNAAFRHPVNNL